MTGKWSLKRAFLRTLIVALVSSALVAIYMFLFSDFGKTEGQILLTTLTISYFSCTSLACVTAFEKKTGNWLAMVGLVVSMIGLPLFLVSIWAEWRDSQAVLKTNMVLAIFSFSLAQTCLLEIVPLKPSLRWVFYATTGVVLGLATMGSGIIVFETSGEWLLRILGVLGILDGCGSLMIPVLSRLSDRVAEAFDDGRFNRIELTCPRCGHRDTYSVGTLRCTECALEIRVQIAAKAKKVLPKLS